VTNHRRRAGALLAVGGLLLLGWVSAAAGWLEWAAMARWAVHRAGSIVLLAIVVELVAAGGWLWLRRERPPRATPMAALSWWAVAGAGVVVAGVAWGATSWLLSEASLARDVAATRVEAIKTGLSIAAGTGGVFALLLAVRRQWHHELNAASTVHDATERRMTELYIKAVEQLGSDKAPVRLGGLYALERLAQDSPDRRQTVVNVLCAYLRMPFEADDGRASLEEREVRLTAQRILANHLRPGPDPARPLISFWSNIDLKLTGAYLIDLDLTYCRVRGCQFDRAQFSGRTMFRNAQFTSRANFHAARFGGSASFDDARFGGSAWFTKAKFIGVTAFAKAQFTGDATFEEAEWGALTVFNEVVFRSACLFQQTTFVDLASFVDARYAGEVRFDGANFGDAVHFLGVEPEGEVSFEGAKVRVPAATESWWLDGWKSAGPDTATDGWVALTPPTFGPGPSDLLGPNDGDECDTTG
jgi:uncharacterized protein YjbI with pentapeptide repeats